MAMFAAELEQLARLTAGRPDLSMVVGGSGSGWHFNWMTGVVSIDGEKVIEESPDYNRGLVLHEATCRDHPAGARDRSGGTAPGSPGVCAAECAGRLPD